LKEIILTIDYELFLGKITGTVEKCMVEPTYKLAEILGINNSKMTVFWDILHYYRLTKLESQYPEIKNDRKLIDEQISFLVSKGHDIQLHIHPHWLDAEYKDSEWRFKYNRFKLHALSEENNPENIDTIIGCISISKMLMEKEIRKYLPGYFVSVYRAGGYLIEPFEKLKIALEYNNIYVDSSTLPGMTNNNHINGYDFKNYPEFNFYRFSDSPSKLSKDGKFTEIPITTLRQPVSRNILFTLIRKFKYPDLESGRVGTGSEESAENGNKSNLKKILALLTKAKKREFTTDGNFAERFNYMCRKVKNNSTMILHPKLLNEHTLDLLKEKVKKNCIKFISIDSYLKSIG
jgi:hypothetical protein